MKQLQLVSNQPARLGFFEAQVLIREGKWADAAKKLEAARPQLLLVEPSGELTRQADLNLGLCYERLQQPDRQREAYQRVLQTDPSNMRAKIGLAKALAATGQPDEALYGYLNRQQRTRSSGHGIHRQQERSGT